jgi:hypothetical protein
LDLGYGWVHGTQLSAKGAGQEFDELIVEFTDINRDEYMIRFNDNSATVVFVYTVHGEDSSSYEELEGEYSWESILEYLDKLPKTFSNSIRKLNS